MFTKDEAAALPQVRFFFHKRRVEPLLPPMMIEYMRLAYLAVIRSGYNPVEILCGANCTIQHSTDAGASLPTVRPLRHSQCKGHWQRNQHRQTEGSVPRQCIRESLRNSMCHPLRNFVEVTNGRHGSG